MKREAAGFILYKDDGHYLLLRSARNQEWGFPKGHRDPEDPDLMTTALRELEEETGISQNHISVDPSFESILEYQVKQGVRGGKAYDKRVVYMLASCPSDTKVALSEEHDQYQWCELKQAKEMLPFPELADCLEQAETQRTKH